MPRPRHVLLVDDDVFMHAVLARLVKRTWPHATIIQTFNGAQALSAFNEQRPDLIITDVEMPILDGFALVRTLRAQGATLPILALSSESSAGETMLAAGADHFLEKPFRIASFTELLHTLLLDDPETRALGK